MGPFEGKNIRKVAQCRKKLKEGILQSRPFRKCSKKLLAKERTRSRDRWVHRKPSKVCTKKWYIRDEVCGLTKKKETRRERLKSALYLRLEKRRTFFLGKNFFSKLSKIFFLSENVAVPKNVKGGTLWALLTYILLQNIKKLERGTLLRH